MASTPVDGAEIITFFAPASIWASDFSFEVKTPLHSNTISIPSFFQGKFLGSRSE